MYWKDHEPNTEFSLRALLDLVGLEDFYEVTLPDSQISTPFSSWISVPFSLAPLWVAVAELLDFMSFQA